MLQQFLCATILCVTSTMCSAADKNVISEADQKKLACMPTILRDICKDNMDNCNTTELLNSMEPLPSEEKLKEGDHYRAKKISSNAEANQILQQKIRGHVSWLVLHHGLVKRKHENVSPKTVDRVAHEMCDYIFFAKQPQEHPYDAQEEENNWMRFAKKMPARFAELSIPLIKQYWNDPYVGDTGVACRSLGRIAYFLSHPDKALMIFWAPLLRREDYEEVVHECIDSVVCFSHGKKEDYELVDTWTKEFMKVFSKN